MTQPPSSEVMKAAETAAAEIWDSADEQQQKYDILMSEPMLSAIIAFHFTGWTPPQPGAQGEEASVKADRREEPLERRNDHLDITDILAADARREREAKEPIQAHSKSEFRRLAEQGANVLPPSPHPAPIALGYVLVRRLDIDAIINCVDSFKKNSLTRVDTTTWSYLEGAIESIQESFKVIK